jgi:hypothetical protein
MTKKVYNLKHATPKMKYQHMKSVMEFKANLKDSQNETLTVGTRQWMIEEIKHLSPDSFAAWYDEVYKLRSEGKHEEYKAAIKAKYAELTEPKQYTHRLNEFTAQEEETLARIDSLVGSERLTINQMIDAVELFTPRSYKDKHVPDKTCPKCGGLLIVKERHRRLRSGGDEITPFVACSMWERTGCRYKEEFTAEVKAVIDNAVYDIVEF